MTALPQGRNMPLYEYECFDCGAKFELLRHRWERLVDTNCKCGGKSKLLVSLPQKANMAEPFSVLAHDGTVLHQKQTTEKTVPPGYRYDNPNLMEV